MTPDMYNDYQLHKKRRNEMVLPILCLVAASLLLLGGIGFSVLLCFFVGPLGIYAIPVALLISLIPVCVRRSKIALIFFFVIVAMSAGAYLLQVFIVQWTTSQDFIDALNTLNQVWFMFF